MVIQIYEMKQETVDQRPTQKKKGIIAKMEKCGKREIPVETSDSNQVPTWSS